MYMFIIQIKKYLKNQFVSICCQKQSLRLFDKRIISYTNHFNSNAHHQQLINELMTVFNIIYFMKSFVLFQNDFLGIFILLYCYVIFL